MTRLFLPFTRKAWNIGWGIIPIAIFVFLATVNAVNLTPENLNVVPIGRTVNNKALSSDITLSYSDVGGASSAQGSKADSAIQGVRGNGTAILPDESRIVNITPENIEAVPITRRVAAQDKSRTKRH